MLKTFDTKDAIPAELQSGAIETKDGKFIVDEPEDRTAFDKALNDERAKREAAEKLVKKQADDLKRRETERKAGENGVTAEKLAEIEKQVEERIVEKYKPQIDAAESLSRENRELKLDQQIKVIAGKAGVIGAEIPRWWKQHGDAFDLTPDGKPIVKGKEGLSLEKYIGEDLKKETPYFYEGTKAAGSGAAGITTGSPVGTTADDVLKNPGAALAAARAAGKTE